MLVKVFCSRSFLAPVVAFALLFGCDQTVDKGGDKLTEGRQSVEVHYKASVQTVLFDNLETQYPVDNQTPVVHLDDIVLGSGLVTDLDGTWLNFIGADDFHPIGVCPPEYAPTRGEMASRGYIERGTTRLIWDDEAEFEKCMSVRDVVTIEIADEPDELPLDSELSPEPDTDTSADEEGAPFETVRIHFAGAEHTVVPTTLETATLNEASIVRVDELIEAAGIQVGLDQYTIDFEGSGGYRPSVKGTCEDYLPAPGELADRCGVNIDTSQLLWDASLEVESCAMVKRVAHIYIEPK